MTKLMRNCVKRGNIEIHHIIEKRFQPVFRIHSRYWPAVAMSKSVHRRITNRFKDAYPYNMQGNKKYYHITEKKMQNIVKKVYKNMYTLRKTALKQIDRYYTPASKIRFYRLLCDKS